MDDDLEFCQCCCRLDLSVDTGMARYGEIYHYSRTPMSSEFRNYHSCENGQNENHGRDTKDSRCHSDREFALSNMPYRCQSHSTHPVLSRIGSILADQCPECFGEWTFAQMKVSYSSLAQNQIEQTPRVGGV